MPDMTFPARLLGAILVLLAMLSGAAPAWAHAALNASEPEDGALVDAAPAAYSLTFSEPVAPLRLTLVKPDGVSLPLDRFELTSNRLSIEAPDGLGRGTHVLAWRVVSADGHPIGGSVVFSIGEASAEAPMVEEVVDWTVRSGLWLSKIGFYVGLLFGTGGVFAMLVLMPGPRAGRSTVVAALALGAAGAVASIGFQGLDALGAGTDRFLEPAVWSAALDTSYGNTVMAALVAFALGAVALVARGRLAQAVAALSLIAGAASLALSGHASAAAPQWLMRPSVLVHAAAASLWIGALPPLGLALRRCEPGAVLALRRFSAVIPAIVVALVLAGSVLAYVQVERPAALVDTAYGRVLSVKLALLVALFALAAVNRWSLTRAAEAGEANATRRLVRSVVVETLIALLILGAVSAWRFTPPPRALAAAAAAPATAYIHTEKALAYVWLRPGRAGPTEVSVNILTGDFARLDAKEVTVALSNPEAGIEPFRRKLVRAGEANWRADAVLVPLPGLWRVRIEVLVSDFEMVRLEGEVRIRPSTGGKDTGIR